MLRDMEFSLDITTRVSVPSACNAKEQTFSEGDISAAEAFLRERIGLRKFATVQGHALYRSRHLDNLDDAGIKALLSLGIVDVFDLRKPAERTKTSANKHPFSMFELIEDMQGDPSRTQVHRSAHIAQSYGPPGARMTELYRIMGKNIVFVRDVIKGLTHASKPALVHCVNGKDRTGVVCACVQYLQGMSESDILADYLLTNELNAAMNTRDLSAVKARLTPYECSILSAMFEARESYLQAFWDSLNQTYGSLEYLLK